MGVEGEETCGHPPDSSTSSLSSVHQYQESDISCYSLTEKTYMLLITSIGHTPLLELRYIELLQTAAVSELQLEVVS